MRPPMTTCRGPLMYGRCLNQALRSNLSNMTGNSTDNEKSNIINIIAY